MVRKKVKRKVVAKKINTCCDISMYHHHPRCIGLSKLIIGVLILLNAYYAWLTWDYFIGGLLVILGLLRLVIPVCLFHKRY